MITCGFAAEKAGARERSDVRHAGLFRNRRRGAGSRRADAADQREHALDLDQTARVPDRGLRFVAVVHGHQFQPPTMNAAAVVGLLEGRLDAEPHSPPQFGGRSAERRGLPEQDAPGRNAWRPFRLGRLSWGRLSRRRRRRGQQSRRGPGRGDQGCSSSTCAHRSRPSRAAVQLRRLTIVTWLRPRSRLYDASSISALTKWTPKPPILRS